MKNFVLVFISILLLACLQAQNPNWNWVVNHGGTSGDYGIEICADAAGNSYTIGYFSGTMTVGGTQLVSLGASDVCIIKSNSLGDVEWALKAGGTNTDTGWDVALGPEGSIYITGYFWGEAYFGSTTLTTSSQFDIFVAKLTTDGAWLWAKRAGGPFYDQGYGIATDAEGNCFVTGYYTGLATFGSFSLNDATTYGEEFVAKLDSSGNWLWATTSSTTQASRGQAVATDTAGNAYVTGSINSNAVFGTIPLACSGNSDTYVAKLDTNGNWLWAVRGGGAGGDWGLSLDTNSDGYTVVTGGFASETAQYGTHLISGDDWGSHIFVTGLNSAGDFQWAVSAGSLDQDDESKDVALDASGNAYLTGYFEGTSSLPAQFGTFWLVPYGGRDVFITKLNSTGDFQWVEQAGSNQSIGGSDGGYGIAVSSAGPIMGTGIFTHTATFGPYSLTASGYDLYITRLDEPPSAPGEVTLLYPADGALNLPLTGFDFTWEPDPNSPPPEYYRFYLATDPEQIYEQFNWTTTETNFDPVADQGFTYAYDQEWYWTVSAVNSGGSSVVLPPRFFFIQSEFTVVNFPANWDFENPTFPPDGWTTADADETGTFWTMMTEDNHTPGGSQTAVHSYSTEAPEGQTGWMITPPIAVPAGQQMTLSFWNKNWWEDYYDYSGLLVNTTNDPNDPNWVELWSPIRIWHDWIQEYVDISNYGGQTVYFAFKYEGYDAHTWIVDDVSIYQVQTVNTFPAVWDFEDTSFPPLGWSFADLDGIPSYWQATAEHNNTPGGGQAAIHTYSDLWSEGDGQDGWLISPPVEVPLNLNTVLDFWYVNLFAGANVYCAVKVNTVNNPRDPNWVELWRPAMVYEEWQEQVVNISAYGGQTVYFAFQYQGYNADDWILDDISIYHPEGTDTLGPVISYQPIMNTPRYDLERVVTARVTDDPTFNSGLNRVIFYYKHWGSETFITLPMNLVAGNTYSAVIPAAEYYDEIDYYFAAWDIYENLTHTPIYSWYFVENPCWLYYDWGGTGHQSFNEEFGAAVMYENPFFDQGTPMQVLQTGCGSNIPSTATLHIYAYDGTFLTDLMSPLPVSLSENEWITYHDLSSLAVMVDTQYFMVAYEDIPANTGIWHDRRVDYDASFRIDNGVLSDMLLPGSWVMPAQVTNGGLTAPEITIELLYGYPLVSWQAVPGANWYEVYSSADPYAVDPWDQLQGTSETYFFYTEGAPLKFFKVMAKSDIPRKSRAGSTINSAYKEEKMLNFAPQTRKKTFQPKPLGDIRKPIHN